MSLCVCVCVCVCVSGFLFLYSFFVCQKSNYCLIEKKDVPCGQWSLGHVVEVIEGDDGFVQVVKVQVGGSVVTCSIMKICTLEVNEGSQNVMTVCHGWGE